MTNPEIQKYFTQNAGSERICGHFRANQVESKNTSGYDNLRNRFSQIKIKPIRAFALFSLSLMFSLTSCMGKAAVDGEPALDNSDTVNEQFNDTVQNAASATDSIKSDVIPNEKAK